MYVSVDLHTIFASPVPSPHFFAHPVFRYLSVLTLSRWQSQPDYMRKEKEKASLKMREEQVRALKDEMFKDIEKDREQYKKEEGAALFTALLRDLIKDHSVCCDRLSWCCGAFWIVFAFSLVSS